MNIINHHQRAAIGWEVLIQVAKNNNVIRYGELGKRIGIHHRVVRYVLSLIQDYCLDNKLPPLTILVVNQSGLPGEGFIAWDVDHIDEGIRLVQSYNWSILENPFGFAQSGVTEDVIIDELLEHPENTKDVYAKIKVRGIAQIIFRKALLRAYDGKCAFCGFSFGIGLQASHIVPWSKANITERLDVRNGILLCATHHILFDSGCLTVDEDYNIKHNHQNKKIGSYSEYDSLLTTAFNGKKMVLPVAEKYNPQKEYLKRHAIGFNKIIN